MALRDSGTLCDKALRKHQDDNAEVTHSNILNIQSLGSVRCQRGSGCKNGLDCGGSGGGDSDRREVVSVV